MSQKSHPIRNGIIVAVVSSILVSAIPAARDAAGKCFLAFWNGISWINHVLTSSYQIPGWLITLTTLITLYSITNAAMAALKQRRGKHSFSSYVQDRIYGLAWRWRWQGQTIKDLWCYCPSCDAVLVYDDSSARSLIRSSIPETKFICENCNRSVVGTIQGGDKEYAVGAVKREISRRIRTGERPAS